MDVSLQWKRFLPPLTSSSGKEREAYVKNRHEELRLARVLEQLQVQEKVYLQLFQKEKQVVEGRRTRFCSRIKSQSLSHVPSTAGPRGGCRGQIAPSEERPAVSDTPRLCLPRSYSMPNSMPLWDSEGLASMRQTSTLIMEEVEDPGLGSLLPSIQVEIKTIPCRSISFLGQHKTGLKRLKKSPLPTNDAELPKLSEECLATDPGLTKESDQEHINSVKVCSASSSYTEKIRHRPLSASSLNPKSDQSKYMYDDVVNPSKPSSTAGASRSRPSSATNRGFLSDANCDDKKKFDSPGIEPPTGNRPSSASNLNHSSSHREGDKVLRSFSVHDISQALKFYRHKTVSINNENIDPIIIPLEKRNRRSSERRHSLKGSNRLRKNSFFDTHMVLKQELQMLEKRRMRQRLSKTLTIDDAIGAEKVRYKRCIQNLESFFNRMTQFNTDDGGGGTASQLRLESRK